jgi:riboflavin kinase/FMN adenylyltransferase
MVIRGVVVSGDRRGRALGFPTANLRLDATAVLPAFGIYAGLVDGRPAAISVGVRPTFGTDLEPLLEAHILDYSGDLYGTTICVEVLQRIRGEMEFNSATELVEEMHRDVARVRELIGRSGAPESNG